MPVFAITTTVVMAADLRFGHFPFHGRRFPASDSLVTEPRSRFRWSDLALFGDTRRSGYDARNAITVSLAADSNVTGRGRGSTRAVLPFGRVPQAGRASS
jgi:hypothetical protein